MKKNKNKLILTTGVILTASLFIILLAGPQFWSAYSCNSSCSRVESEANTIMSMIADYFSVPHHTIVESADISNWMHTENPWTIRQCGNVVFIYVYDLHEECPEAYQDSQPEWDSGVYTKIMD